MHPDHHHDRSARRRGFTLIELVVALTVISVATTILIQLYVISTNLGILAQHREIAATIADSRLTQISANPQDFEWDSANPDEQGLFRVKASSEDPRAGMKVPLPSVLIPAEKSYEHQANLYDKFRWIAFGRIPSPESTYVEVTVTVRWSQAGREERVTLTSAIPRSSVDPAWGAK